MVFAPSSLILTNYHLPLSEALAVYLAGGQMKVVVTLCSLLTAISIGLIFYTFVSVGELVPDALMISLLISSPLILLCIVLILLGYFGKSLKNTLFHYIVLGSFIGCCYFHVDFNLMMLLDVLNKGSLGPAQGYWLLILVFGSGKPIAIGGFIGFVVYLWLSKKTANKKIKQDK